MELKKNPKHDLHRYRTMLFATGLIISLSILYIAFQWRVELVDPIVYKPRPINDEVIFVVPVTNVKEPERPKPIKTVFREVPTRFVEGLPEPESIQPQVDVADTPAYAAPLVVALPPEPDGDQIIDFASDQPLPKGGYAAFYDYLRKNIKYPRRAQQLGIEGKVFVQFVVEKDGTLSQLKVVKGIGAGCDEEAMRVLQNTSWIAGKQRARNVRVRMVLPVTFALHKR